MKQLFLPSLISLLLFSCGKDNINPDEKNTPKPDSIVIYDIPDTVLVSIDSVYADYTGIANCFYSIIPYPSHGKAKYELDIDSDSVVDFIISIEHNSFLCPSEGKCGNYDAYACSVEIKANVRDSVVLNDEDFWYNNKVFFRKDDTIKFNNAVASSDWSRLINNTCSGSSGAFAPTVSFEDCYLGIKKNNCMGWIHFDNVTHGVVIMDYALNYAEGNSIIAGKH